MPFDSKKRGPEERAAMLERLGFKRFAYDWRTEHIPTFDAEIEDALGAHPAVQLCAAVGAPDAYAGELPVAYVQLAPGATAGGEQLASFAFDHIPDLHTVLAELRSRKPYAIVPFAGVRAVLLLTHDLVRAAFTDEQTFPASAVYRMTTGKIRVYVASSPDLNGVSGRFFLRCRTTRTKHITYDIDFAAKLWSISEALNESRASALSQID